jgi:hypothetical protein
MKYLFSLFFLICSFSAFAQSGKAHSCKHPLAPTQVRVDGNRMNLSPGDTICLLAGRRPFVHFSNIIGSKDKPIIIRNCGGRVVMGGPAVKDAFMFLKSKHFRLTGTGDPTETYGIFITETQPGSQGVQVTLFSTDVEIDHLEIQKAGFAGIMAKTDPLCDGSADRGAFTMENVSIHHNYIHHSVGEGIYLGNSFYTGTEVYCDTTHYPHEVKNVRVYSNILEDSGWEAIQVGSAVEDCGIHDNRILNYGLANKPMQNNGIQIGKGTTGKVYNNFIKKGMGAAIVIQGIGDNYVFNNLIIEPGAEAFNINTREPMPEKGVYIVNNTVVGAKVILREHVNTAKNNVFINNLIVGAEDDWNYLKPYTDWTLSNNLFLDLEEAGFYDPQADDFRIRPGSKACNAGKDASQYLVEFDFLGRSRKKEAPAIGAFEFH